MGVRFESRGAAVGGRIERRGVHLARVRAWVRGRVRFGVGAGVEVGRRGVDQHALSG